ncbi:MAG TPA: DNA alkylation repair protein [Candidatus Nanoarchaeia archaeon]
MTYEETLKKLKSLGNPKNVEGMARFGINPENTYGVSIPNLRKLAKEIGKNHGLAQKLWDSGIHEAKILAGMVDDPKQVTKGQMDAWAADFDSWDVCDQGCMNLFDKTTVAYEKAIEWSKKDREFEKRAGFALMACLAWHDKESADSKFMKFSPLIKNGSTDERNFVKKAVNWALRQIGKRNKNLNKAAIEIAKEIQKLDSKPAKWIASDALRELQSSSVQKRLRG